MNEEMIVLLDDGGRSVGTAPKRPSHHENTPLHLAFSSYLTNADGQLLLTQRAHDKLTFPSVWTNSCCGHPAPGETLREAVTRRVADELGLAIDDLTLILPRFRYTATAADGTVENEMCPVVRARVTGGDGVPDSAEVAAVQWRDWAGVRELTASPQASPWFVEQMEQLVPLGEPREWPAAGPGDLPSAIAW